MTLAVESKPIHQCLTHRIRFQSNCLANRLGRAILKGPLILLSYRRVLLLAANLSLVRQERILATKEVPLHFEDLLHLTGMRRVLAQSLVMFASIKTSRRR
jgi:hypothetical protein